MNDTNTNSLMEFMMDDVMIPDPVALRDVINAHQMYDAPSEPLVLSLSLYDIGPDQAVYGDTEY